MSAISNAVFLSKIKEVQTEIRKLDVAMEKRSEKLAQAFMQYKEGELSKEAYTFNQVFCKFRIDSGCPIQLQQAS